MYCIYLRMHVWAFNWKIGKYGPITLRSLRDSASFGRGASASFDRGPQLELAIGFKSTVKSPPIDCIYLLPTTTLIVRQDIWKYDA